MNIGINCGHTLSSCGRGAVGIKDESIETRVVGKLVMEYLKKMNHVVEDCTVDNALSKTQYLRMVTDKANSHKLDLFVSIHFNSATVNTAHGTEVFTFNDLKQDVALRVVNNISKLGFVNRGIKDGSDLYVVKNTKAKAILIECCFINNKEDMAKYNPQTMALAIAEGISGTKLPIDKPKPVTVPPIAPKDDAKYKVVVKSYLSHLEAEKLTTELKAKGYKDTFILKV